VASDPTGGYGGMFLDDETIVYTHTIYLSDTEATSSVHLVRDGQDTLLIQQDIAFICGPVAAHRDERVAILCGQLYVLDVRTAAIIRTEPAVAVLGFSADGQDVYVKSHEGDVMRVPVKGEASVVVHAAFELPIAYLP
jgi:hypothetical protein